MPEEKDLLFAEHAAAFRAMDSPETKTLADVRNRFVARVRMRAVRPMDPKDLRLVLDDTVAKYRLAFEIFLREGWRVANPNEEPGARGSEDLELPE